MRALVCLSILLISCSKGEPTSASPEAKVPALSPGVSQPASEVRQPATAAPSPVSKPEERSWNELTAHAQELETRWPTINEAERFAFYKEWTRSGQKLIVQLKEEADAEELESLYRQEQRPASLQFLAEEGFAYAVFISPSWLLRTFPALPVPEKAFLSWLAESKRDTWFAEGSLQVSISEITSSYQKGAMLLARDEKGFRTEDIGKELDAIMRDATRLLSQPPNYSKKKYQRDLSRAFAAMAKTERHRAAARILMKKFPMKGIPYSWESIEAQMSDLGLLD